MVVLCLTCSAVYAVFLHLARVNIINAPQSQLKNAPSYVLELGKKMQQTLSSVNILSPTCSCTCA